MIDWRIALFTLALSMLTGIVFGLVPALQISKPDIASTLKDSAGRSSTGARRHGFMRKVLVASEMGLAVVLLASAMLLIRSFVGLSNVSLGIDPRHVLTMQTSLGRRAVWRRPKKWMRLPLRCCGALKLYPVWKAPASPLRCLSQPRLICLSTSLASRPKPATNGTAMSNGGRCLRTTSRLSKFPCKPGACLPSATPFTSSKVLLINRAMANKYWKNENPVGQVVTIGKGLGPLEDQPREIVGIVGDVRETGAADKDVSVMYVPASQQPQGLTVLANSALPLSWAIRSNLDTENFERCRSQRNAECGWPDVHLESPLHGASFSEKNAQQTFNMLLLSIFAGVALVLAAIGIYGLMSYSVEQQTAELGVRMALGAGKADLFRLVVKQGMTPALMGVGAGLGLALLATRVMKALLFGIEPNDPLSFIAVAVTLSVVALVSIYLPARRAMGLDPLIALRQE